MSTVFRPTVILEGKDQEDESDTWVDTPHPDAYLSSGSGSVSVSVSGSVSGSDISEVGFKPQFENPDDPIPMQSVFLARAHDKILKVELLDSVSDRVAAILTFLTFLLRPEYAPFHRAFREWRYSVHEKCAEFMREVSEPALHLLCRAFMTKYPL